MALRAMTACGQVGVSAPEAGDLDDVFEALLLLLRSSMLVTVPAMRVGWPVPAS